VDGKSCVRNDVLAREQRVTERTIDRGDRRGAPYLFVYGVKYRPEKLYGEFIASGIKAHKPVAPKRRRVSKKTVTTAA
jgi:hypothetical protein